MTIEKSKTKYIFDNPNTHQEIERVLKKIALEKLFAFISINQRKVN